MAPRKKLTLSDLKPAMAEAAAKPAPAELTIKPTAPPAGLVPVDPREIGPSVVSDLPPATPDCNCRPPVACLFGGVPYCEAPQHVRRGCLYATGGDR